MSIVKISALALFVTAVLAAAHRAPAAEEAPVDLRAADPPPDGLWLDSLDLGRWPRAGDRRTPGSRSTDTRSP